VLQLAVRSLSGLLAGVTLPQRVTSVLAGVAGTVAVAGAVAGEVVGASSTARRRSRDDTGVDIALHGSDRRARRVPGAAWLWATATLIPVLALYPIHLVYPWFEPRVVAFCVVPLCLFLASGLEGWAKRGRWAAATASALIVAALAPGLYDYAVRYRRYDPTTEDYLPLIEHVAEHASSGDVLLYNAPWHVGYFRAYYDGPPLQDAPLSHLAAEDALGSTRQVWLVLRDIVREPGGARPEDRAEDALSARSAKVDETWYGAIRLARYAVAPPAAPVRRVDLGLGPPGAAAPSLFLRTTAAATGGAGDLSIASGEAIYVTLTWEAAQQIEDAYHVTAQLVGPYNPARGNPVWAQHDGIPANQERPTTGWTPGEQVVDRHAMWVDDDAPAGAYTLQVGVYDPQTGSRLYVWSEDGAQADAVVVAALRVVTPSP
jgi:hypothetical protein